MGEMVAEESVQSTGAMMAKVNKRCELASVKGIGTPAQVDEGVVVKFTLGISRTVTVIWFVSSSPPPFTMTAQVLVADGETTGLGTSAAPLFQSLGNPPVA